MAIPSSYTEFSLAAYMLAVTGNVAAALGWDIENFDEAVNDALVAYGVSSIADATDIAKLRALAKVEAWRTAVNGTAADIEFSADGGTYKRNQMHEQALAALERAEAAAMAAGYADSYAPAISMGSMIHVDPYLSDETIYSE